MHHSAHVRNAMTVDVEDYFHVSAFAGTIDPASWSGYPSRVSANTSRLLDLFAEAGVRATFFVLGWVAEHYPALVRRIHAQGHELASHSYDHGLVYEKTPEAFRADLRRAGDAIQQAAGVAVRGYRAPSFSITKRSLWALEVLAEEGYVYDSSVYPIRHDRYGIPDWPRTITRLTSTGLWEIPGATIRMAGANWPVGGGGYFRLLPYAWTRFGLRVLNERERVPMTFYLHPWEIDPGQPQLPCSPITRLRHYGNLDRTEGRLKRLLRDGAFGTVSEMLSRLTSAAAVSCDA